MQADRVASDRVAGDAVGGGGEIGVAAVPVGLRPQRDAAPAEQPDRAQDQDRADDHGDNPAGRPSAIPGAAGCLWGRLARIGHLRGSHRDHPLLPDDGCTSTPCACPRAGEGPDVPPAGTKVLLTGQRPQLSPASVFGRRPLTLVPLQTRPRRSSGLERYRGTSPLSAKPRISAGISRVADSPSCHGWRRSTSARSGKQVPGGSVPATLAWPSRRPAALRRRHRRRPAPGLGDGQRHDRIARGGRWLGRGAGVVRHGPHPRRRSVEA